MYQFLDVAATWWLQAAALAAIGLVASNALRKPALQSHVLRVTIVAVLLCPLATQLMSRLGVTLCTVDLQSQFLSQATPIASQPTLYDTANDAAEISRPFSSPESPQSSIADANASIEPLHPAQEAITPETATIPTSAPAELPSPTNWLASSAMTLLLIWAAGTLVLLARLLVDLQRGRTLLHESVPADSASDQVCRQVTARLHIVSPPRVVVNPFLSSPCLLGHWRPAILLPEEINPTSYDQVFLHELAHLRRSDWLWTIIGRVARSILWCQPLVWRIHRQHMSVAEEICDDYVIEHGCDRESYLQQLIQIAESSLPQTRPVGVSMVGFRSKLGRRTARILDTTRVISTQAGRCFVAVAMLSALMTTTGVALVEIGQAETTTISNSTTADTDDATGRNAAAKYGKTADSKVDSVEETKRPHNAARTYTGKVTDPDGKPLADVTISAINSTFNAKSKEAVDKWIANARPELLKGQDDFIMMNNDPRIRETQFPRREAINEPSADNREVATGANGEFQWDGIGEDCQVQIKLSGPTIASREAAIVTRDMSNMLAFNFRVRDNDYTHYGASPTIVASPTQPIKGEVVDADSGMPLKGIKVVLTRISKSTWSRNQITATTDDEGRFQLSGAPLGGGHVIEAQPPLDQPYFKTEQTLPVSSNAAPLQCKLELHKTKWIRGRVTDEAGKPVVATLNFYPFRDNKYAEQFSNYDQNITGWSPDDKIISNADGEFRIQAIAGPAVLAAFVTNDDEQSKYLSNRADGLLDRIGGDRMRNVFNPWVADYFDAMVEVNIDPDVNEIEQNLVFKLGSIRTLMVRDERGAIVEQISVLGTTFPPRFNRDQKLNESSLEIIGLQQGQSRMVVLLSSDGRSGKLLAIDGTDTASLEVQLEACAIVTGRVLNQDSEPVANMEIRITPVQEPSQDNWSRELVPVVTDGAGQFEMRLPPGGLYRLWSYSSMGPNFKVSIRPTAGASYQLGDLKDALNLKEEATEKFKVEF